MCHRGAVVIDGEVARELGALAVGADARFVDADRASEDVCRVGGNRRIDEELVAIGELQRALSLAAHDGLGYVGACCGLAVVDACAHGDVHGRYGLRRGGGRRLVGHIVIVGT